MKNLVVAVFLARIGGLIAFQQSTVPPRQKSGTAAHMSLHDEAYSWWGDTSVVKADQVQTYVKPRRATGSDGRRWDYDDPWNSYGEDWASDYDGMPRYPRSDRRDSLYDRYTPDPRRYSYGQRYQEPQGLRPRRNGLYNTYGPSRRQVYEPEYYDYDYYDDEPPRGWGGWYENGGRRGPLGELSNDESRSWWGQTYVVDDRKVQTFVKPRRYGATGGDYDNDYYYRTSSRPVTESDSWWGRSDVLDDRQVQTYVSRRRSDSYKDRRPEHYYDAEVL